MKKYDEIKENQIVYVAKDEKFLDADIETEDPDGTLPQFTKLQVTNCKNEVVCLKVLEGEFKDRVHAIYWWGMGEAKPEEYLTQEEYDLLKGNIPPVNADNYWEVTQKIFVSLGGIQREQFKRLITYLTEKTRIVNPLSQYQPGIAIPPGETLAEVIKDNHMSTDGVARMINMPEDEFEQLIKGQIPFTEEIADKLTEVFTIPASFWIKLEAIYRETLNRLHDKVLSGEAVRTHDKTTYDALCQLLSENGIDFVSGDVDPLFPDEPYYVELN